MKVKEFIMKMDGSDLEILNKLAACKSPDEAYDVAKSYGVDDPQEVFENEMNKFNDAMRELNENDLESVAGGVAGKEEIPSNAILIASVVSNSISTIAAGAAGA